MKTINKSTSYLLWTARIWGSLVLAFLIFFVGSHLIGAGEINGEEFQSASEVVAFMFFPISTLLGLSLALKWEGLGGLITVSGILGLSLLRSDLLANPYIYISMGPGFLYLIYWIKSRRV